MSAPAEFRNETTVLPAPEPVRKCWSRTEYYQMAREYWIINLVDRVVEVHRSPAPDAGSSFGHAYRDVQRLAVGKVIALLATPAGRIDVAAMLP
jgi:hypothetical protein